MGEEVPPMSDRDLRVTSIRKQDKVFTIQDVIDALEGSGQSETQVRDTDPDTATWKPNIGEGFDRDEYMRGFYRHLLDKDGTY